MSASANSMILKPFTAFVMNGPTTTFLRRGGPVPAGYQVAIAASVC